MTRASAIGRGSALLALGVAMSVVTACVFHGKPTVCYCGSKRLFDCKTLEGWTVFPAGDLSKNTWSVRDGVLVCEGNPVGYIKTTGAYKDFTLTFEWRFDPKKGAGNSGVLLRMEGADQVWPKSIEAQLHSENAGDIWNIGEFPMTADAARTQGRRTVKEHPTNEKPLGEWNKYAISLQGDRLELWVNGLLQNVATGCGGGAGPIGLQAEGAYIEFRNIVLAPRGW